MKWIPKSPPPSCMVVNPRLRSLELLGTYHAVTHRKGYVCIQDPLVLRNIREIIITDTPMLKQFQELSNFHADDIERCGTSTINDSKR